MQSSRTASSRTRRVSNRSLLTTSLIKMRSCRHARSRCNRMTHLDRIPGTQNSPDVQNKAGQQENSAASQNQSKANSSSGQKPGGQTSADAQNPGKQQSKADASQNQPRAKDGQPDQSSKMQQQVMNKMGSQAVTPQQVYQDGVTLDMMRSGMGGMMSGGMRGMMGGMPGGMGGMMTNMRSQGKGKEDQTQPAAAPSCRHQPAPRSA